MSKIIWMSDPHFQTEGTIGGLDPRVRLAAAIEHANTLYADADCLVLSGDLVGDDVEADYPAIASYLSKSRLPVLPLMGNNDSRRPFRAHLLLPDNAMPKFVQYVREVPEGVVICLDTHLEGSAAGAFCQQRCAWLDETLAQYAGRSAFIFMHHPPMALGLPPQDEIKLQDAEAFLEVITKHDNVSYLFMGHVHRPTSGVFRGIPFTTLGALSFQAPAPRPAWHWDTFQPPAEAPEYAVVLLDETGVTIQFTQFCDYQVGVDASE